MKEEVKSNIKLQERCRKDKDNIKSTSKNKILSEVNAHKLIDSLFKDIV